MNKQALVRKFLSSNLGRALTVPAMATALGMGVGHALPVSKSTRSHMDARRKWRRAGLGAIAGGSAAGAYGGYWGGKLLSHMAGLGKKTGNRAAMAGALLSALGTGLYAAHTADKYHPNYIVRTQRPGMADPHSPRYMNLPLEYAGGPIPSPTQWWMTSDVFPKNRNS